MNGCFRRRAASFFGNVAAAVTAARQPKTRFAQSVLNLARTYRYAA
jgi:hypothetical protein